MKNQKNDIEGKKTCNKCKEEKILDNFTKDRITCKICLKEYYILNKNKYKENSKNWYNKNKQKHSERVSLYQKDNKESLNKFRKTYYHNVLKIDLNYKIANNLRTRLCKLLKTGKLSLLKDLIGCNKDKLIDHLEKQFLPVFTWKNYGEVWEIDHIKPCSNFDLSDPKQQKICFNYKNLQPLFKTSEIAKSFGYINEIGNRNKSNK